ncbi:YggT family protein [Nocardioides panacisoli]|uniref:YggT family protein n=1 Tax=Nocardioides panacisoli TaxID=627624 RepID=UPI001C639D8E|nr:YggT family protein [Nocardioides panacisoli]QYJ04750.1 YggT family protein [Nocardioides panacisoli]
MTVIGQILYGVLFLFMGLLWIRFLFDWVQVFARSWTPTGVLLVALEFVYTITDPPIRLFRRFIPPLRLGNVALDLSFILVLILVYIAMSVVRQTMVV